MALQADKRGLPAASQICGERVIRPRMSSRIRDQVCDEISSRPSRYTRRTGDEPIEGYRLLAPLGAGGFGEVWKCRAPGGLVKAMKIVTLPPLHDGVQGTPADQEHGALNRIKEIRHPFFGFRRSRGSGLRRIDHCHGNGRFEPAG